jgi:hypothetical protein
MHIAQFERMKIDILTFRDQTYGHDRDLGQSREIDIRYKIISAWNGLRLC